jgi:2-polyprenyl-6-methoxyphenol hydroxylase-like FAD-dependent oxidoreductase
VTDRDDADGLLDVLVVGAGPSGLALAAQLREYRARFRIVDRAQDRVHESRALAVQPRTLEVLARYGSRRLGLRDAAPAHYLIRPDGHVSYRGGPDLTGLHTYLTHWFDHT